MTWKLKMCYSLVPACNSAILLTRIMDKRLAGEAGRKHEDAKTLLKTYQNGRRTVFAKAKHGSYFCLCMHPSLQTLRSDIFT